MIPNVPGYQTYSTMRINVYCFKGLICGNLLGTQLKTSTFITSAIKILCFQCFYFFLFLENFLLKYNIYTEKSTNGKCKVLNEFSITEYISATRVQTRQQCIVSILEDHPVFSSAVPWLQICEQIWPLSELINGISISTVLCLVSLNQLCVCKIQVVLYNSRLFILIAPWYFIIWLYRNVFILSAIEGHLGNFQCLALWIELLRTSNTCFVANVLYTLFLDIIDM